MDYSRKPLQLSFTSRKLQDGYYAAPYGVTEAPEFELDADENEILPEGWLYLADHEDDACRVLALCFNLGEFEELDINDHGIINVGKRCYRVLDDSDADKAWDGALDSFLDECVPGADGPYFDRERWKSDAKIDGRGHNLASYDGNEEWEDAGDQTYYIYRLY